MKRGERDGVDSGTAAGAGIHPATQTMRGGRRSTLQWPVAGARESAAGICADPSPTSAACMNRGQSDRRGEVARTAEVARAAACTARGGVSLLRASQYSVLMGWLGLPEGTSLNCSTRFGRRSGHGTTVCGRRRRMSAGSSGLSFFMASAIPWRWVRPRSLSFCRRWRFAGR